MSIEIVGPLPPPYGGVSVHIERLMYYLNYNAIDYIVYNQSKSVYENVNVVNTRRNYFWFLSYLIKKNGNTVHFHQTMRGLHFLYWFLYSRSHRNKIIITIHNEDLLNSNQIQKKINLIFLKYSSGIKIICVSKSVSKLLERNHIINEYLPAYVPPHIVRNKKNNSESYNIFCNIWKIIKKESIIKYGIDLILDLMCLNEEKSLKTYIFLGCDTNCYILEKEIYLRGLQSRVEIIIGKNLVEHFYYCNLLVRPNREDAYGVSIQEAHDCNVPSLSSDVCVRPKGTTYFKTDDLKSLNYEFNRIFPLDRGELLINKEGTDYHLELLKLYKQF